MILNRNNKQYIEIEQFADYELTQCIAYEMAVRNSKYQDEAKANSAADFLAKVYREPKYTLEGKDITITQQGDKASTETISKKKRDGYTIITKALYMSVDNPMTVEEVDKKIQNGSMATLRTAGISTVETNFKRPPIYVDSMKTNEANLNIDLNKPLNEIIALVTHIKNDIDKNNLMTAPIGLFGIELEKADSLVCNDKGKCFDARKVLSIQQRMADMFFIYDALKLNYNQTKIRNMVYNYYADKGIESITLDPATLRKYRDIAIEYIDNTRYYEMQTGIKQ